jgi:glycosyltransferase involved in cell wall biosynthesis
MTDKLTVSSLKGRLKRLVLKIMIIKYTAWDYETFYKLKHPEYVAIRNIVSQNPSHDFILFGTGQRYEHFRIGKTKVYNLGYSGDNKFAYLLFFFMKFWLPISLRPSIIVDLGGRDIMPTALASKVIRAKLIPTITNDIWYEVSPIPKPLQSVFKSLLRASFHASLAILAISESIKKELIEDFKTNPKKVFVYQYKISDIFSPYVSSDVKKKLNPGGPIVLTVCRISPQKGLQYLVEAALPVVKKFPSVKFVIRAPSSEAKYRANLLRLIKGYNLQKYFEIIEEVSPYEEIPKYMVAADVFVLPSISEGLGIVILEAMACGVPVIGSRIGGIPDIIVDKYNGLLVQPRDAQGLSNAIITVLSNENLRSSLSQGALLTSHNAKQNEFQSLLAKLIARVCDHAGALK